jgi:hypothetical protein
MDPRWILGGAWDQDAWFYNMFLLVLDMLDDFWVDSGSDQESFGSTRRRVPDTRGGGPRGGWGYWVVRGARDLAGPPVGILGSLFTSIRTL